MAPALHALGQHGALSSAASALAPSESLLVILIHQLGPCQGVPRCGGSPHRRRVRHRFQCGQNPCLQPSRGPATTESGRAGHGRVARGPAPGGVPEFAASCVDCLVAGGGNAPSLPIAGDARSLLQAEGWHSVLLPSLPPAASALLRSQAGPHAGAWLTAVPAEPHGTRVAHAK